MTIDKSKLISVIETHLRDEYVGKSTTSYHKNHIITDVRCEINEKEAYFEDGGIFLKYSTGIFYTDFKVQFLVRSPKGKIIKWIVADTSN